MGFNNPYGLSIRTIRLGDDYLWLVTGGVVHIGATAQAYWSGGQAYATLLTVPGHREGELALELAELACTRLQRTVTVVAGIHIDQAERDEIQYLVEEIRRMAREELDFLSRS